MVFIAGAVEHDLRDSGVLGSGCDALPDLERLLCFLTVSDIVARHRHQCPASDVIDQLRGDVLERAVDHKARSFGRACHLLAYAEMAAIPLFLARLRGTHDWHGYLPPALPAFRRTCSPA